MTCEVCQLTCYDLLDRSLCAKDEQEVLAHIEHCPDCRAFLEEEGRRTRKWFHLFTLANRNTSMPPNTVERVRNALEVSRRKGFVLRSLTTSGKSLLHHPRWTAFAASFILLLGVSSVLLKEWTPIVQQASLPPVRIINQSGDVSLSIPQELPGLISLAEGEATVRLGSGVELKLLGPVSLEVVDCMKIRLEDGRLLANVPKWATGFTISTPSLEIEDLGTVFSVATEGDLTDVFVFKGRIKVGVAGQAIEALTGKRETNVLCVAGEGVRAAIGGYTKKFSADTDATQKKFGLVSGRAAYQKTRLALSIAREIADLRAGKCLPEGDELLAVNHLPVNVAEAEPVPLQQQEETEVKSITNTVAAIIGSASIALGVSQTGFAGTSYSWNGTTGGNWNDDQATGWNTGNGSYPNAIDDSATITQNISANSILNLNVNALVGSLVIGDSTGTQTWTLQDTGALGKTLTFDVSSGWATLTKPASGGNVTFNVPFILNDSLAITNSGGNSAITIYGPISGAGDLTLTSLQNSSFTSFKIGNADSLTNTYIGSFTWTGAGDPSLTTSTFLELNKAAGVHAITGDFVVYGKVTFKANEQIGDVSHLTIGNNGYILLSDRIETVDRVTLESGGLFKGTGSSSSSKLTATTSTEIKGGAWSLVGRGGQWDTGTFTINGGTNNLISATSTASGDTLSVNTLIINQPVSGAFTALTFDNTQNSQSAGIRFKNASAGDVLAFVGTEANTHSTLIDATFSSAGVAARNTISLAVTGNPSTNHTFNIGNGGADVDLIIRPNLINGTGTQGFTKTGDGTLELGGTNLYTGATSIDAGRLLINGSLAAASAVAVKANSTLGGLGTVPSVSIATDGTLAPGTPSSTGILTVSGNVSLQSNAVFSVRLNSAEQGSGYDQLVAGTSVNLSNAVLSVSLGYAPSGDSYFTIINNTGASAVAGTFLGLPEGTLFKVAGRTFSISYKGVDGNTGNDVVLRALTRGTIITVM